MELDELKRAWAHMELRQDGMEAVLRTDIHDRRMDHARRSLRLGLMARGVELAAWIAFTVFAAQVWVDNLHVAHWLVIGLLLHLYGVAGIWASATQLLLTTRIYLFDAPVVVLQRRLTQLRRFRVWCTLSLGLPWWFLWLLVPLAFMRQFAGVDLLAAGSTWVWANMAVGAIGMGLSVWLARHVANKPIRSPFWQRIVDDMSGCALRRTSRQLDELACFERV